MQNISNIMNFKVQKQFALLHKKSLQAYLLQSIVSSWKEYREKMSHIVRLISIVRQYYVSQIQIEQEALEQYRS